MGDTGNSGRYQVIVRGIRRLWKVSGNSGKYRMIMDDICNQEKNVLNLHIVLI